MKRGKAYHESMGRTVYLHDDWEEQPVFGPLPGKEFYDPCDYFGGDIEGIISKLDDLKRLGISCIYLNPIGEAASNHRYNTSDYKKYLIMMAVTALVSEIPYDLSICGKVWDFSSQNAMITMCICLIMLKCLDLFKETSGFTGGMLKVLILIAAIVWVSIFRAEYGLCIVLLVFVFYVFETRNVLKTVLGCIISLMYVTGPIAFYGIWCCTGERKDHINKYVYYAFYPLHLLVLGVIANYIL